MRALELLGAALLSFLPLTVARAEVVVKDDEGRTVRLAAPARRVVSLAPHATENLFAAGAGARVVGVVEYSDFPAAAAALPRIGGYSRLDLERILALSPDLIVAWKSGNPKAQIDHLEAAGLKVYFSQPNHIEDVASELERFGVLTGAEATGHAAAAGFRERLADLRRRWSGRPPVRVFYQVWHRPITTVGGKQIISDVIHSCGGINVFSALGPMAPVVSEEAVLAAEPEVIIVGGMGAEHPEWLDPWRKWPKMTPVARENLFSIPPDLLQRHTPRLLEGAERLCAALETARGRRPSLPDAGARSRSATE
jgi:iron complex transport system substrate-binding protein